jgi:hypothetical protein
MSNQYKLSLNWFGDDYACFYKVLLLDQRDNQVWESKTIWHEEWTLQDLDETREELQVVCDQLKIDVYLKGIPEMWKVLNV